jgi:predicted ATPase
MLSQFERAGNSQFVIATHSPILLALPGAQIFSFDGPQIREVRYQETQHYQIYKQFFSNPVGYLQREPSAIAN